MFSAGPHFEARRWEPVDRFISEPRPLRAEKDEVLKHSRLNVARI